MAQEIKSLQEGNEPELSSGKDKTIEEAHEKLMKAEKEKEDLVEKLDSANKIIVEVIETRNTLMKVVESVSNNNKVKKTSTKIKKKIKCREYNKPEGCAWGIRCRFDHGEVGRLTKQTDCSYWMDGHCHYEEEVCWNIHNPVKKGSKSAESKDSNPSDFQEGQEEQRPKELNAAKGMEGKGWVDPMSRKRRRQTKAMIQEKERLEKTNQPRGAQSFPLNEEPIQATPTFPLDGDQNQQILLQVLRTLLQHAGGSQ